ncbi:hypothetical protein [Porphyromonas sp.]
MNRSEQIREKLTALSELDGLFNSLLFERDKGESLSILSEAEEQIKTLIGSIEEVRHLIERGHARIQDGLRSHECAPSHRENRLEDDDRKVEFPSLSYEEPPVDTTSMGMPHSPTVFYIKYQDIKSKTGDYMRKPEDETQFQITVSQSDPSLGWLQFRDGLDEYSMKEIQGDLAHPLIRKESSWGGEGRSQGTPEDGRVSLDRERNTWRLLTPIKIK